MEIAASYDEFRRSEAFNYAIDSAVDSVEERLDDTQEEGWAVGDVLNEAIYDAIDREFAYYQDRLSAIHVLGGTSEAFERVYESLYDAIYQEARERLESEHENIEF